MPVPLTVITRKKLILVRQIYQRAILQGETQHSDVDRILSIIGLDLTIETVLKALVTELEPKKSSGTDINALIQQADNVLISKGLPEIANKVGIRHVHELRNDAQHKAKYPNKNDVSDCRTYTRDFLIQVIHDVWGEDFESISLVDVIEDETVRDYLKDAEKEFSASNYKQAIIKSIAGLGWTISNIKESIVGRMPHYAHAIVVSEGGSEPRRYDSTEMFDVFYHLREMLMRSVIGVSFPGYLRYLKITKSYSLIFMADGHYQAVIHTTRQPTVNDTEFVLEFATNTIIQIESLVGDINKPFEE